MKKSPQALILLILLTVTSGMFPCNKAFSEPVEELKVTLTKNDYNDFQNSIITEKDYFKKDVELEKFFFGGYDLIHKKFDATDIIKSAKPPVKACIMPKSVKLSVVNERKNVYNINISGKNQTNKASLNSPLKVLKSPQEEQFEFENALSEAKDFIDEKNYAKAENLLDDSFTTTENSWNLAEIAMLYEKIQKYNKSLIAYEKALSKTPERIELIYSYALCLNKINQIDRAQNNFLKIIKINPDFMLAHYNLGSIYYQKTDYYKALNEFYQSVKLNPLNADAFYNLALTLEVMNQKHLAYKYYLKCLQLSPEDNQAIQAMKRLERA